MPDDVQAGAAVQDLVAVMDRLRSPGGCPWDAEQTHASLLRYAVEEVYEVVDAVESGDRTALREELGDLLLQVVFHARVAQEHPTEPFDLDDVAAGIAAKLRRRHPHVFAGATVRDAAHVEARWDEIKAAEAGRRSVLDGIPAALPALARAQKTLARAAGAGLDVAAPGPASPTTPEDGADAVGARLLALVAEAEQRGVDAEAALRRAVDGYAQQVRTAEQEQDRSRGRDAEGTDVQDVV